MRIPMRGHLYVYSNGESEVDWKPEREYQYQIGDPCQRIDSQNTHSFRFKRMLNGLVVWKEAFDVKDEEFLLKVW